MRSSFLALVGVLALLAAQASARTYGFGMGSTKYAGARLVSAVLMASLASQVGAKAGDGVCFYPLPGDPAAPHPCINAQKVEILDQVSAGPTAARGTRTRRRPA